MRALGSIKLEWMKGMPAAIGSDAPGWVQLFPSGAKIDARDGRSWSMVDIAAVIERSSSGPDLPVDWNHSEQRSAPSGGESRAAGWITKLEERDGAIFARIEWTDKGRESITSREYRYISPWFLPTREGVVHRILGASLVNTPALDLPALANENVSLVGRIDALERTVRSLTEVVESSASSTIGALAVEELDAACSAGLITPAERGYHERAIGNSQSGLDRFRNFVAARERHYPSGLIPPMDRRLNVPPPSVRTRFTVLQSKVAQALGRTPEFVEENQ